MFPETNCCVDTFQDFFSDRVEDGMEIFPALNSFMDAVKTCIAFMIGLVQWIWMILAVHLKNGKDFVVDSSAPHVETGKEIIADYAGKTKELSENLMNAGLEMGKNAAETAKDYSEQAKDTGNQALGSAMELGGKYFNAGLEAGTSFFHEDDDEDIWIYVMPIGFAIVGIVIAGLAIAFYFRGWLKENVSDDDDDKK